MKKTYYLEGLLGLLSLLGFVGLFTEEQIGRASCRERV